MHSRSKLIAQPMKVSASLEPISARRFEFSAPDLVATLTSATMTRDFTHMAQQRSRKLPKQPRLPIWTPKVTARAQLAELLHTKHAERARKVGLLLDELRAIGEHGRKASRADNLQKEQLAMDVARRGHQKDLREDAYEREIALRDRIHAIVGELVDSSCPDERRLGLWLSNVSYARYRLRALEAPAAPDQTGEPIKDGGENQARVVKRVLRTDMVTRMRGLAAYCDALLEPEHAPIIARLERRGMPREDIEKLSADARELVRMGPNVKRPVPATLLEAEAVRAQNILWRRARLMIRRAVQGVPELERRWKEC